VPVVIFRTKLVEMKNRSKKAPVFITFHIC